MTEPMRLFKRGKYWHAEFSGGVRKSLRTGDREEAESLFRDMKKEYLRGRLLSLENVKRISISEFKNLYEENRISLSKWTVRKDLLSLKLLGDVIGYNTQLRAITSSKIEEFKRACKARGAKDISVNGYLRHIKAALTWAQDEGYILNKPKIKMLRETKREIRVLDPDEIWKLLNHARTENEELWRYLNFLLWTGSRRREALKVEWQDLNLDKRRCLLRHTKGKRERRIPLVKPLIEALEPVRKDIGRVFPGWHPDTVSKMFHQLAVKCGVKARLHDLRHSAVSYMLASGIPIQVVAQIAGHRQLATTKIYTHILEDVLVREMQKLRFE